MTVFAAVMDHTSSLPGILEWIRWLGEAAANTNHYYIHSEPRKPLFLGIKKDEVAWNTDSCLWTQKEVRTHTHTQTS